VLLSHGNLVSNIKAILAISPLTDGHVVASFLPMSHVFERVISLASMAAGANVYFFDNQSLTLAELRKIRPHFFATVPRFLEKMHGVIVGFKEKTNPFFGKFLDWAIGVGERFRLVFSLNYGSPICSFFDVGGGHSAVASRAS
jgi:long-chain acyl-CoA synthetase